MASIYDRTWTNAKGEAKSAVAVQYHDRHGKRVTRQFKTKREARRFVETLSQVKSSGAPHNRSVLAPTVREVTQEWLAACAAGHEGREPLERTTVRNYRHMMEHHLLPTYGDLKITEVGADRLRTIRDDCVGRCRSRTYARDVFAAMKIMIGFAIERGMLTAGDPRTGIVMRFSRRRIDKSSEGLPIHSKVEMESMLREADRLADSRHARTAAAWRRWRVVLHVMVFCGLRQSEVRGMLRTSIDLEARTIEVRQRADRFGEIGSPKSSAGYRIIPLPDSLVPLLEMWLASHSNPLAFPANTGGVMDYRRIDQACWQPLMAKAGVRKLKAHSARHFFASMLIDSRAVSLKEMSYLLGHADEAFTLRTYGHLFHEQDAVDRQRLAVQAAADRLMNAASQS